VAAFTVRPEEDPMVKRGSGGLVYSTGSGRTCPACERPVDACVCRRESPSDSGRSPGSTIFVRRETKGRKGKGVTVVEGLALAPEALRALAKELKKRCGSGGTVREGCIEIQGEHRALIVEELAKRGLRAKQAGG
jgi:translation initiation factor 1